MGTDEGRCGPGGSSGQERRGQVETFQVAGAKGSAWGGVGGKSEAGMWQPWRAPKVTGARGDPWKVQGRHAGR